MLPISTEEENSKEKTNNPQCREDDDQDDSCCLRCCCSTTRVRVGIEKRRGRGRKRRRGGRYRRERWCYSIWHGSRVYLKFYRCCRCWNLWCERLEQSAQVNGCFPIDRSDCLRTWSSSYSWDNGFRNETLSLNWARKCSCERKQAYWSGDDDVGEYHGVCAEDFRSSCDFTQLLLMTWKQWLVFSSIDAVCARQIPLNICLGRKVKEESHRLLGHIQDAMMSTSSKTLQEEVLH